MEPPPATVRLALLIVGVGLVLVFVFLLTPWGRSARQDEIRRSMQEGHEQYRESIRRGERRPEDEGKLLTPR